MPPFGRNRPLVALRAMRALVRNPDDLPRVFDIVGSLPGRSSERILARMKRSADGAHLLATRPRICARLADRGALLALPPGSLGRAYAEMTERAGISPEGIVAASEAGRRWNTDVAEELRFVDERMRDTHDLWHVATGYGVDVLGELGVLAFVYAQTRHPGVGLILAFALVEGLPHVAGIIRDGYRRGRRAAWLPSVVWEDLLDRPLGEVRALLGVGAPPIYTPVTTADLRAAGRLEDAA